MQNTGPSSILGVFRDQTKAENAVEKLKEAGFTEDQVTSKVVSLHPESGEQTPETTRTIVIVKTDGNEKQAFGILFSNGANNADLPPGISLSDSRILGSQDETVPLIPKEELEEGSFTKDSFFGERQDLETTDQMSQLDNL